MSVGIMILTHIPIWEESAEIHGAVITAMDVTSLSAVMRGKGGEEGMTVKEAIMTLNANAVIACERAGFSSATVKMIEDALDTIEYALKAKEQQWTPITFRPLTEEEKTEHPEWCYIIDSPTPDDGEDILVSNGRAVWTDVWGNNGTECYLESDHELEGVAWMKMPTPWKKEANT